MPIDLQLERRLTEWGRWSIDVAMGNVGYPRKSPIVDIIEVGIICPFSGPREPYMNERAQEIELLVKRMNVDYPKVAYAIRLYYLYPNCRESELAHKMGIGLTTLKDHVKQAKMWLSGRLSADN